MKRKQQIDKQLKLAQEFINSNRTEEAIKICQHMLHKKSKSPDVRFILAKALITKNKLNEAINHLNFLIKREKDNVKYLFERGKCHKDLKNFEAAMTDFDRAIKHAPGNHTIHLLKAYTAQDAEQYDLAFEFFKKVIDIAPGDSRAYHGIALAAQKMQRNQDALEYFNKAIEFDNDNNAILKNDFALFCHKFKNSSTAISLLKEVIKKDPNFTLAYNNLGAIYGHLGYIKPAYDCYAKVLQLEPFNTLALSNMLMNAHYDTFYSSEELFQTHLKYQEITEDRTGNVYEQDQYINQQDDKRLRIGYVSRDFWTHSVAFFMLPILEAHDTRKFEVFCFSDTQNHDKITERIQRIKGLNWIETSSLSSDDLTRLIKETQIDILVDLAGHTGGNRLEVFAKKSAPVQITYLGYPDTTGLSTIDYRLTDQWADPPGKTEHIHSEQLLRLENGFLCYEPPPDSPEVISPADKITSGITFGSFNNLTKYSPIVIKTWSELLNRLPEAKLFLKSKHLTGLAKDRLLAAFKAHGIDESRITMERWSPTIADHLDLYNQVDIALDTFPYNGTTTTFEALYMGTPVVTISTGTHVTRVGASILTRMGLENLITHTLEDYINKCIQLADDRDLLHYYSSNLRQAMTERGLLDGSAFTQGLEQKYRDIWNAFLSKNKRVKLLPPHSNVKIHRGLNMVTSQNVLDKDTYTALEHEDTVFKELQFIRNINFENTAIHIGSGVGAFALSYANLHRKTKFIAIDRSEDRINSLKQSCTINLLNNLIANQLHLDSDSRQSLDIHLDTKNYGKIDILIFSPAKQVENILNGCKQTIEQYKPLIVFKKNKFDVFHQYLQNHKYSFFKLLPELDILSPVDTNQDLELSNASYFFACTEGKSQILASQDILLHHIPNITLPPTTPNQIQSIFESQYSYGKIFNYKQLTSQQKTGWEVYFSALHLYHHAKTLGKKDVASAALHKSYSLLRSLCEDHPSFNRFLSLARVAYEIGFGNQAIDLLTELENMIFEHANTIDLAEEPFLCPCPRFENEDIQNNIGDWILASIIEQQERIKRPSSYDADEGSLHRLSVIDSTGFGSILIDRQLQLLKVKHGHTKKLIPSISLSRPAKNNKNYFLWKDPHKSKNTPRKQDTPAWVMV